MPQIINTNIMSLNAQRNLNRSQTDLQVALQRLSSGLRINSAKDDAAGMAISERFSTQIRGLNQAVRNANDGISLAQTGEGAIAEITNNLQRIRELAVQSANATNSASDRAALDQEVQQRLAEIERVATQTSFNGQKILDGTFGSATFQVGANVGETISVALNTGLRTSQIGQIAVGTGPSAVSDTGILDNDVTINGVEVAVSVVGSGNGQSADSAYAKAEAINASGIAGVTATAVSGTATSNTASTGVTLTDATDAYSLEINSVAVASYTGATAVTQAQFVDQINLYSSQTGVTAAVNGSNEIELTAADGRNIVIDVTLTQTGGTDDTASIAFNADPAAPIRGSIQLTSAENITIVDANDRLGFGASATITLGTETLGSISVTTVDNANTTIQRVDAALTSVNNLRSTFGAIQNRFESTIANLSTTVENLTASRSRILDADFAAETAALSRAQILQQAGVAMLAQANVLPQTVLALLQ